MKNKKIETIWNIFFTVGFILTLLCCALFILSAYSGMANPLNGAKLALLGMSFPIWFYITLLFLITWCLLKKWKFALAPLASLVICAAPVLTYCPLNITSHDASTDTPENSFTLLTYNVMNFTNMDGEIHDPNMTLAYILDTDADIVCLQEGAAELPMKNNKLISAMFPLIKAKYKYVYEELNDLLIFSKYPYEIAATKITRQHTARSIAYRVNINGKTIDLINVHLQSIGLTDSDKHLYHNITELDEVKGVRQLKKVKGSLMSKLALAFKERASQVQDLREYIDSCGSNVILCGDFNDTPNSYAYRTVMGEDMHDAYTDCAFGPTITYHDNRFYFKIDNILYRGDFKAVDIKRGSIASSDHYPLLATFRWKD